MSDFDIICHRWHFILNRGGAGVLKINTRSIMFKILVMIIAISVLEAFILISMSGNFTETTLEKMIDENSMKNAELYSEIVGNWFSERVREIEIYANNPLVRTMDWKSIKKYLQDEIRSRLDVYDHFFIVNEDGYYMTTLDASSFAKDREYFKDAMAGKVVVSDPIISRTTGNQISVVAAPIRNNDGKVVGVMGGTINLVKLSKIIANLKYSYPGSYTYIVDNKGLIIAHPNEKYIMKENITILSDAIDNNVVKGSSHILNNKNGSIQYTFDEIPSMNYFQEIPNTKNWKLIVKIPINYWRNPVKYANISLILIGLLGFIVSAIMGLWVSKSISSPIIKLRQVFNEATAGGLTVRSDIDTDDEVGDASRSFNKMMDTISRLTYYDALTQLPNRMLFNTRLDKELEKAALSKHGLAVMILDIDRFESINNTLGLAAGDKLLKCLAEKLSYLTDYDCIVSHMGEDRFAVLFKTYEQKEDVLKLTDEVRDVIRQPWMVDDHRFYITACIGMAFYPEDGSCSDSLFKNAFSAMLKAKSRGRDNCQLYDPSMNAQLMEQLNLDSSMHHALDNGEFSLHYQPQIDAESGEIVGCEALIRWNHPELGMISPLKFIPISEANGLIILIGRWVLYTACMQNKLWQEAGNKPIYVSVNLSVVQLIQEDFIDMVSETLAETGLSPEYLELEITESVAVKNHEYITGILEKLKKMGIRIALDDFGTGYSSLNYLKNFAINTLKIDRSFISDINENPKNAAIVSSILAMGKNLKLNVTAEGVETKEQYETLRDKGCKIIQGYYFSKPLPLNEFEKQIKKLGG